ncbi:hypothetical protein DYH09_09715 [bacterium CPR1]|nr:hypothetical protein [bacterium CPR1]
MIVDMATVSSSTAAATLFGAPRPVLTTLARLADEPVDLPPVLAADRVYAGDRSGNLQALDASGAPVWSCRLKGPLEHPPTPAADGSVYVLGGHHLHRISPEGKLLWARSLSEPMNAPVVQGERIYVGTRGCMLLAFDRDGNEKARIHNALGTPHSFFVLPGPGKAVLLVGNQGRVVQYDPTALLFKSKRLRDLPGMAGRPPRLGPDGRYYFITMEPGMRHHLVALQPATGRVEMDVALGELSLPGQPGLGLPGSVALALAGGAVHLYDTGGNERGILPGLVEKLPVDPTLEVNTMGSDGALITGTKSAPRLICQGEELEVPADIVGAARGPEGWLYVTRKNGDVSRLELRVAPEDNSTAVAEDAGSVRFGSVRLKKRLSPA